MAKKNKTIKKPKGYWTKERCLEEAKKYKTLKEWSDENRPSYVISRKKGFGVDCSKHMHEVKKPKGYWTKERCLEEAKKYETISEWLKNKRGSYNAAYKNNWIELAFKFRKK